VQINLSLFLISANSLLAMKSEFCTTILKEENRGLTVVNHRYRLDIRVKKILMCEGKDTELICAYLITRSFIDQPKIYILIKSLSLVSTMLEISPRSRMKIDQSHWSTDELFKCDWSILRRDLGPNWRLKNFF